MLICHYAIKKKRNIKSREAALKRWRKGSCENTNSDESDTSEDRTTEETNIEDIKDLFQMCISQCGVRKLSVLLYMLLRNVGLSWKEVDKILSSIGGYSCQSAHKWKQTFLLGDFEKFVNDGRGGKHSESFYDTYPEIEAEAKQFAVESCSKKNR